MRYSFHKNRPVSILYALAPLATALLFAGTAFAAGTHTGDHGHGHGGHHSDDVSFGQPAKASEASRTVEVIATDIAFEPSSIQVSNGETVRFVVHNRGKLLHEFNIGTPDMHAAHQEEMQMMMEHGMMTATGMNEHMEEMEEMEEIGGRGHASMPMQHDDPNSILLEPGETKELVWTFEKTRTLEFACNVPGHYQAGMVGKINFR